jgi:protein-S-isoprenylcysteine O-methyltransferase Ste14
MSDWSIDHLRLLLAWCGYFLLHSLFASLSLKRLVARYRPDWLPGYRLAFNAAAVLLLMPVLILHLAAAGEPLWRWHGVLWWIANGAALLAVIGFLLSSRCYSSGEFLGIAQLRRGRVEVEDQESFQLSTFHHHVRHPWYSLALVLVWSREMDLATLIGAVMITLYLVIGSRLEEQRLVALYGERYRIYQQLVPALIPRPWRRINSQKAAEILGACQTLDESAAKAG